MEWNADKYHANCSNVTEHGRNLVNLLRSANCDRVLDLGCGTGTLTNDIAKFAIEVIGIDSSPAMIAKAKENFPELEFINMDACSIQWDNHFDIVFSNAVFHFIQNQHVLLKAIHTALKKDGMLICEFGASGNISALLSAVSHACVKRGMDYKLRFFYPEKSQYEQMLSDHDFRVQTIITYDLDTKLSGTDGLRNWVNQVFSVEMGWFDITEKESVLLEIESTLRETHWRDGHWNLPNKRLRVVARK